MPAIEAQDSAFESRVRGSFARQRVMQAIGASLTRVSPGEVEIVLPFREDLTQQHGFLHAGIVSTIADSACGYAAYSLGGPAVFRWITGSVFLGLGIRLAMLERR